MMTRPFPISVAIVALAPITAHPVTVKALVPGKPWEVALTLPSFEPFDVLQPKTILGGEAGKGLTITVIVEKAKPGTTAAMAREQYGKTYALGSGDEKSVETSEIGDMAVILYRWHSREETWGFNGYKVKDDVVFDVHVTADLSEHAKDEVVTILKSFEIKPSTELDEMAKLDGKLRSVFGQPAGEQMLLDFAKKFPDNTWVYYMLGEHYFGQRQLPRARDAYMRSLANHKSQPFANPLLLWKCYDGLGLCHGMMKEYAPSRTQFERAYELAKDLEDAKLLATSAYNLACWHAENREVKESVKYLTEAIAKDPGRKNEARTDSSFDAIRDSEELKRLLKP